PALRSAPDPFAGHAFMPFYLYQQRSTFPAFTSTAENTLPKLGLKSKGKEERIQGLSKKSQNPNAHYQLARNQLKNFNKTPIELMRQILTNFLSAFISYLKGSQRLAFEIL
nr:hypothetical protein [Tenuifilaceae bacterium]